MSRDDPGAATGQQPYEPERCTCGELQTIHKDNRGACSASTCKTRCKRFEPARAEQNPGETPEGN